ncbi:MAG: AIPR family protein [Ignavibacteria bacterium]|nr:AIPR family protein [Ignavibacteria bacterium]MBI3765844.1 AIPR family protein [Ignavibacteriales bacterium]
MNSVSFIPTFARKFPDPLNSSNDGDDRLAIEHFLFICQAKGLPDNIPIDPNPREQNTDLSIYKEVKRSLLDSTDSTFHLKNKGITIIADSVKEDVSKKLWTVYFREGEGIVDGAHTYKIINDNREECPDMQAVKVEIITGVPHALIVDIARGLNTSVQVQQMSLANLDNKFQWVKDTLKGAPYEKEIAYKQNEDGEYTARDIVSLMTLFNIDLFPDGGGEYPKIAYTSKEECLKRFLNKENESSYLRLKPIVKDILELYDYIHLQSPKLYDERVKSLGQSAKGKGLAFFQSRKKGKWRFIFIGQEDTHKLSDGAIYPMLGAFRYLIAHDKKTDTYRWKTSSFSEVKRIFDQVGGEMMISTRNTSDKWGRKAMAIGKDDSHWENLYKTVALAYLQNKVSSN